MNESGQSYRCITVRHLISSILQQMKNKLRKTAEKNAGINIFAQMQQKTAQSENCTVFCKNFGMAPVQFTVPPDFIEF